MTVPRPMLKTWAGLLCACLMMAAPLVPQQARAAGKQIVYITAKLGLPFWATLGKGVQAVAEASGYDYSVMDSNLSGQTQLENTRAAIARGVVGIVLSPVDSKTAPAVLDLAMKAKVPVVIADIGTNGGDYVSYVKSDNYRGAYEVGTAVAAALKEKGWAGQPYALITISLARKNGQDRTTGFRDAMAEARVGKEVALRQMQNYSFEETEQYVKDILAAAPNVRSFFIETDQPTMGALQALKTLKKSGEVVIGNFDAMPEVAQLLKGGTLVACGMQQPYLMGNKSAQALIDYLRGETPPKQIQVPILVATSRNIDKLIHIANKTVFGRDTK